MKPLAKRTAALRQSGIRAITKMVHEVDGINLGQGICDMPTPKVIKEAAVRAIRENRSVYSHYAGIEGLRKAIFQRVRTERNIPASSDDEVMLSVGSTGAFTTAILALLDPGDEVIVFEPYYGYHVNLLRAIGAEPVFVPLVGDQWRYDTETLAGAVTDRTKAILITTPGNPHGKVWKREELAFVLELLQRHGLYALTDEIYEYMLYDGNEHVSLASLDGAYDRTLTISGFSKTYNMTGWRLGFAVGKPPLIEKMGLLNDLLYICAPTPLQHGILAAFDMDETYFTTMAQAYDARRARLCSTLEKIGFSVAWPQGSYYVLAAFDTLANDRSGFSDDLEACKTLINVAGIGTVPGRSFFNNPLDGRHLLRFCFAKEMEVLSEACDRLLTAFGSA